MAKVTPIAAVVAAVALVVLAGVQVIGLVTTAQSGSEAQSIVDELCGPGEPGVETSPKEFARSYALAVQAASLDARWQGLSDAFEDMAHHTYLMNYSGLTLEEIESRYPEDSAASSRATYYVLAACRDLGELQIFEPMSSNG